MIIKKKSQISLNVESGLITISSSSSQFTILFTGLKIVCLQRHNKLPRYSADQQKQISQRRKYWISFIIIFWKLKNQLKNEILTFLPSLVFEHDTLCECRLLKDKNTAKKTLLFISNSFNINTSESNWFENL